MARSRRMVNEESVRFSVLVRVYMLRVTNNANDHRLRANMLTIPSLLFTALLLHRSTRSTWCHVRAIPPNRNGQQLRVGVIHRAALISALTSASFPPHPRQQRKQRGIVTHGPPLCATSSYGKAYPRPSNNCSCTIRA